MNKDMDNSPVSNFLNEVTDQISYKPLRPAIRQELEDHIEDRMEEYESQGISTADAERQVIHGMGDAVIIGTELNEAHKLQKAPWLAVISALLLLIGFAFSSYMIGTSPQVASGPLFYIPGGIFLIVTSLKGYPLVIRYRKMLALLICSPYAAKIISALLLQNTRIRILPATISYFDLIMFSPMIIVMLYSLRLKRKNFLIAVFGGTLLGLIIINSNEFLSNTAAIIFILSTFTTICFMIHRRILIGRKKYLYSGTITVLVLLGSSLFLTDSGQYNIKTFLMPQSSVHSTWDDTYNAILIQELLSRTSLTHGLELSSEEMVNYGTGAWYFASRDPKKIDINATGIHTDEQHQEFEDKVNALKDQGYFPKYVHFTEENVTLWDILPQHYHNNYLIAVSILLFGWIPGLALIGAIVLFFVFLFSCINRIHGKLASSLAFCCGQCLLWQGVFYLLGNFGYQYSNFPNLPMISEGRVSIMFNMLLLGLIFSAYRYDRVMEEPVDYKPVAPA